MVVEAAVLQGAVPLQPVVFPLLMEPLGHIDVFQLRSPQLSGGPQLPDTLLEIPVGRGLALRQVRIVIGQGEHQGVPSKIPRHHQFQLPPGALIIIELLGRRGGAAPGRPPPPSRRPVRNGPDDLNVEQPGGDMFDCFCH